ncbi:glycosyltransferase [Ectocarpus siliculosus]|uniref:Glycosyltransferase n=1 Tax=Ectocarpus siliculosus TaxID=2880 RepID=D7FTR8_ECTSI|nr:glycosyltransferase [Ectocarpus siliculosus]|eukprot:CBJ31445.1 glycosyltransferase [Ectocarpus siliculosus]
MYTCERLGENATKFKYTPSDGDHSCGGAWQSLAVKGSAFLGGVGLVLVLFCLAWSLGCRSRVREEFLLVVRELGVQVTTKYVDGREKTTFLDKAKIKAILINEGITMHRVVFYLAFVVAGRDKMVVAFENLQPRLNVLIKVYRGTRAAILGEAGDEQQSRTNDMMSMGFDAGAPGFPTASAAAPTTGIVGGGGGEIGEPRISLRAAGRRGDSGLRRTDRIARRQAQARLAGASAAASGWPPPHMPN